MRIAGSVMDQLTKYNYPLFMKSEVGQLLLKSKPTPFPILTSNEVRLPLFLQFKNVTILALSRRWGIGQR